MKIGIITFHCVTNYGGVLQAIALCNKLKEMGHDAKIIDYRPAFKTNRYNPWKVYRKSMKHMFYEICAIPYKAVKNQRFKTFNKEYMETTRESFFTSQEIYKAPPKFDVYITGSDQVWNPQLTGGKVDNVYYLGFAPEGAKKISYAASFGSTKIDKRFWDEIASNIRKIDHVSVRESDGQRYIKEIVGIEAEQVLDPVFLMDKSEWNKFTEDTKSDTKPYLLLYAFGDDNLLNKTAKMVAKTMNLRVIIVGKPLTGNNNYDQELHSCSPAKLLELYKNATAVCTNSFHGTAFSIVYEKPFLVIPSTSRNERIDSLLKTLGLSSQMVSNFSQLEEISVEGALKYDMNKVSSLLNEERKKSLTFLQKALI